jgi:hypothetical protein
LLASLLFSTQNSLHLFFGGLASGGGAVTLGVGCPFDGLASGAFAIAACFGVLGTAAASAAAAIAAELFRGVPIATLGAAAAAAGPDTVRGLKIPVELALLPLAVLDIEFDLELAPLTGDLLGLGGGKSRCIWAPCAPGLRGEFNGEGLPVAGSNNDPDAELSECAVW